jgi:hypothetical protein
MGDAGNAVFGVKWIEFFLLKTSKSP